MKIDIITLHPDLLKSPFEHSIMKRAQDKGLLSVRLIDPRVQYGIGKHKKMDDYQYGGGAGMVIMAEPLAQCIKDLQIETQYDAVISYTVWTNHYSIFCDYTCLYD